MGERAYEQARICDGRPAADSELTVEYNPLEAGLQSAISLTKVDSLPHVGQILFRCAQLVHSLLKLGIIQGQDHLHTPLSQEAHVAMLTSYHQLPYVVWPGCRAASWGLRRCPS